MIKIENARNAVVTGLQQNMESINIVANALEENAVDVIILGLKSVWTIRVFREYVPNITLTICAVIVGAFLVFYLVSGFGSFLEWLI